MFPFAQFLDPVSTVESVDPAFSDTSTCVKTLNKNIKVVLQTQDSLLVSIEAAIVT